MTEVLQKDEGKLSALASWIESNFYLLLQCVGTVLMVSSALFGAIIWPEWWLGTALRIALMAGGGASFVVGSVRLYNLDERLKEQAKEIDRLSEAREEAEQALYQTRVRHTQNLIELVESYLANLANNHLNLGRDERISLYKHTGEEFIIVGRFSLHYEYEQVRRYKFPDDEGCIGKAFRETGNFYASNLPDPNNSRRRYLQKQMNSYGLSAEVVKHLRMPTRTYAAYEIKDSWGERVVGILMFESTENDAFNRSELAELVQNETPRLQRFIDTMGRANPLLVYRN